MAYLFILQNMSANLGGMLTPFGNPQNLYLYSYFNIPTTEFCKIMFPPFALAIILLIACCTPLKPIKLDIKDSFCEKLNMQKTLLYLCLFALSLLIVFRIVPVVVGLVVAVHSVPADSAAYLLAPFSYWKASLPCTHHYTTKSALFLPLFVRKK